MPFNLPSLGDLMNKGRQEFRANIKGSDASIWPNNLYATAKVLAGMTFEVFGFASYISRQKFAHTAPDLESLALHGEEFGIPRKAALPAIGRVTISADNPEFMGSGPILIVATGAILRRVSDGVEFLVTAGGTLATAGSVALPVEAVQDGKAGNSDAGTDLEIVSGVSGPSASIATAAVGPDDITLGADVEDIESWRARILFRKRNPPHGGSAADYVLWAGEVAGVSFFGDRPTVYVERLYAGPGTVRVFPLMFDLYDDGIPQGADIARVADHISAVQPAGASVTVAAAQPVAVNVQIAGLSPNTVDVQEAIKLELRDAFRRLARVAGNDKEISGMPYLAYPVSFSRSWIWQAIANATGEVRHSVVVPAADIALSSGQKAVLGTVTFI